MTFGAHLSALSARDRAIILYRFGFAALTIAAIVVQLVRQIDRDASVVNFFSFFTIESNLIIVVVFLIGGWLKLQRRQPEKWDLVRGAAASYMTTTGIVYVALLSGLEEDLQTTIPWVNGVLHYWMPLVAIADWVFERPQRPLAFRAALPWLAYPLAWLTYSLVRGVASDWFPYPFLDPDHEDQGYVSVAVTTVVIFFAYLGLVWLMARTSTWRPSRTLLPGKQRERDVGNP